MSDSVQPHRWQPTRLPCPWDSPGKNTGVGCHFLLQCMKIKSESEVTQSCPTLSNPMDCSLPGSSVHRILQARPLEWVAFPSPIPTALQILGPDGAMLQPVFFLFHLLSRLSELQHKRPGFLCRHTPFSSSMLGFFPFFLLNPGLPHCRQILYQLSRKGSPNSCQSHPHRISSLPVFVTFCEQTNDLH